VKLDVAENSEELCSVFQEHSLLRDMEFFLDPLELEFIELKIGGYTHPEIIRIMKLSKLEFKELAKYALEKTYTYLTEV